MANEVEVVYTARDETARATASVEKRFSDIEESSKRAEGSFSRLGSGLERVVERSPFGQIATDLGLVGVAASRTAPQLELIQGGLSDSAEAAAVGATAASGLRIGLLGAGAAATVAAGGFALVISQGRQAADTFDAIADSSGRLGASLEFIQELGFGAQVTGVQIGTAELAAQRFFRRLGESQRLLETTGASTTGLSKALEEIGIQVRDNEGNFRSQEEVFRDYIQRLSEVEDGTRRLSLGFAAFDSEGVALTQNLEELQQALDDASRFGLVFDDEDILRAAEANQEIEQSIAVLGAFGQSIRQFLAGPAADLFSFFSEGALAVTTFFASFQEIDDRSLRTLNIELGQIEDQLEELTAERDIAIGLGVTGLGRIQRELDELESRRVELSAEITVRGETTDIEAARARIADLREEIERLEALIPRGASLFGLRLGGPVLAELAEARTEILRLTEATTRATTAQAALGRETDDLERSLASYGRRLQRTNNEILANAGATGVATAALLEQRAALEAQIAATTAEIERRQQQAQATQNFITQLQAETAALRDRTGTLGRVQAAQARYVEDLSRAAGSAEAAEAATLRYSAALDAIERSTQKADRGLELLQRRAEAFTQQFEQATRSLESEAVQLQIGVSVDTGQLSEFEGEVARITERTREAFRELQATIDQQPEGVTLDPAVVAARRDAILARARAETAAATRAEAERGERIRDLRGQLQRDLLSIEERGAADRIARANIEARERLELVSGNAEDVLAVIAARNAKIAEINREESLFGREFEVDLREQGREAGLSFRDGIVGALEGDPGGALVGFFERLQRQAREAAVDTLLDIGAQQIDLIFGTNLAGGGQQQAQQQAQRARQQQTQATQALTQSNRTLEATTRDLVTLQAAGAGAGCGCFEELGTEIGDHLETVAGEGSVLLDSVDRGTDATLAGAEAVAVAVRDASNRNAQGLVQVAQAVTRAGESGGGGGGLGSLLGRGQGGGFGFGFGIGTILGDLAGNAIADATFDAAQQVASSLQRTDRVVEPIKFDAETERLLRQRGSVATTISAPVTITVDQSGRVSSARTESSVSGLGDPREAERFARDLQAVNIQFLEEQLRPNGTLDRRRARV